jgi:hypothetical protein
MTGGRRRPVRGLVAVFGIAVALGPTIAPALAGPDGTVTGRVLVASLRLTLDLSSSTVSTGEQLLARSRLTNLGAAGLKGIVVTLRLDPDGLLVKRPASKTLQQLAPGRTATVSWSICGRRPGILIVLAQATVGGVTVESPARVLTIVDGGKRTC